MAKQKSNSTRKYVIIITILSVLLALTSAMLLIVLFGTSDGSAIVRNNIIGSQTELEVSGPRPLTRNTLSVSPIALGLFGNNKSNSDSLTLSWWNGYDGEKNFNVSNMFPGDSETIEYKITVKSRNAVSLIFEPVITSNSPLADALLITVQAGVLEPQTMTLSNAGPISFPLNKGVASQDVKYLITVTLPTSADNRYAGLSLNVSFNWSLDETEEPDTPPGPGTPPPETTPSTTTTTSQTTTTTTSSTTRPRPPATTDPKDTEPLITTVTQPPVTETDPPITVTIPPATETTTEPPVTETEPPATETTTVTETTTTETVTETTTTTASQTETEPSETDPPEPPVIDPPDDPILEPHSTGAHFLLFLILWILLIVLLIFYIRRKFQMHI